MATSLDEALLFQRSLLLDPKTKESLIEYDRTIRASDLEPSKPLPADMPWREYRNNDGSFKMWLHTWHYTADPHKPRALVSAFTQASRRELWAPLPWIWPQKPGGELIIAMHHMGVFKHPDIPKQWSNWSPPFSLFQPSGHTWKTYQYKPGSEEMTVPHVFGMLMKSHPDRAVSEVLALVNRQIIGEEELKQYLMRNCLLFDRVLFKRR